MGGLFGFNTKKINKKYHRTIKNQSNFEDSGISASDAKKFIRFAIKTPNLAELDFYFYIMNYHATCYMLIDDFHFLIHIFQKHPHEAQLHLPCDLKGCSENDCDVYSQNISYRDLWFDKQKLEMVLHEYPGLKLDKYLQQNVLKNKTNDEVLKEKERNSLYKMIAGMVYARYKYKPTDNKSPTPKDISDDVLRKTGEKIDPDTVRKWLKEITDKYPRSD